MLRRSIETGSCLLILLPVSPKDKQTDNPSRHFIFFLVNKSSFRIPSNTHQYLENRKRENCSSSKIGEGIHLLPVFKMITREKLAEQLKVYQSRSQHKWNSSLVIFSPKPQLYTRTDITVARVLALLFSALVIFTFVAFYFRHFRLSLILICFGILLHVCLKISRRRKLAMKRERRMLLPLSM